ncbi:hypothetical protein LshimejAT787_0505300 [Lyophyllum shimeji]|uniref:Uncharacterized protein n=1 Tax=Lyophyllum shimeji TaxID=47721 RepID=A0A9P3UP68_LYOSH|nr:hypothetical protein LshimejAT787_0505300 [Lyophyllum shimeji]
MCQRLMQESFMKSDRHNHLSTFAPTILVAAGSSSPVIPFDVGPTSLGSSSMATNVLTPITSTSRGAPPSGPFLLNEPHAPPRVQHSRK